MANDPINNGNDDEIGNDNDNGGGGDGHRFPIIPPLLRSPYPTRSRTRRRQLQQQRVRDDDLTPDPLGLIARTNSGGGSTATETTRSGMVSGAGGGSSAHPGAAAEESSSSSSAAAAAAAATAARFSSSAGAAVASSMIGATPEVTIPSGMASNITRRRRQAQLESSQNPSSLFSTPGATTTATASQQQHLLSSNAVPPSATSNVSMAGDYMIGKGLVQAKISPMAGGGSSSGGPGSGSNSRRRRFFPPSRQSPRTSTGSNGGDGSNNATVSAATVGEAGNGMPKNSLGESNLQDSYNDNISGKSNGEDKLHGAVETEKDLVLHGMNITRLRKLTLSCLGMGTTTTTTTTGKGTTASIVGVTTQSPKMAVFFAGMVHSKTKSPRDAYLYARALLQNDQPKRTVTWIEKSNLLRCYYSESGDAFDEDDGSKLNGKKLHEKFEELKTLQVESLLLAAQALSELNDWAAALQLLEDTKHCTFPENHQDYYHQQLKAEINSNNLNNMDHDDTENSFHPNHMTIVTTAVNPTTAMPPLPPLIPVHLDDDDEIAWQQLAESLRPSASPSAGNSSASTPERIHPLSRICQLRARAYSELGHPLRANLYWNRALQIDPWCVLAMEGLLETSVQSSASVVESVLAAMSVHGSGDEQGPAGNDMKDSDHTNESETDDAEWLRALYLARVCTAAPNTANIPTGGVGAGGNETKKNQNKGGKAKPSDADDPMEDEVDENDDGNGDENMVATVGVDSPFALSTRMRSNSGHRPHGEDIDRNDGNDPSFWQDASSIQLLTPIPQQQSVANMSAAGASLFFPRSHHSPSMNHSDHSTGAVNMTDLSTAAAAAVAVGSALDVLWNKFQLRNSPEVLAMAAQNAYRRYDWNAALQYCEELAEMDPLSSNTNKAAFCHVCTLVQLNRKRPLFRLAHEWVEASPKEARSWFAVAAYYYACERYHVAQRHFCRATRLDPHCVEAWIAFGASFAACDESDQALASFRAAQRLAPGNHTSLLYIGMEYLRTNHLVLAQHFLKAANDSSGGTDPLVRTETGVLKLNQRKYTEAITWFLMALGANQKWASGMSRLLPPSAGNPHNPTTADTSPKYLGALSRLVETIQDPYWEPTLFNLAHAYRKERLFDAAIMCLEQCLALKESASAHSALGYCMHLQSIVLTTRAGVARRLHSRDAGSRADRQRANRLLHRAIDSYHQSLAKKPDDPFASEMLQKALSDALEQTDFFLGDDDIVAADEPLGAASDHHHGGEMLASPPAAPSGGGYPAGKRVHHNVAAATPRPARGSLGSLSTSTTGIGLAPSVAADQSSLWTEDGLSVSPLESSNDDVDMT